MYMYWGKLIPTDSSTFFKKQCGIGPESDNQANGIVPGLELNHLYLIVMAFELQEKTSPNGDGAILPFKTATTSNLTPPPPTTTTLGTPTLCWTLCHTHQAQFLMLGP